MPLYKVGCKAVKTSNTKEEVNVSGQGRSVSRIATLVWIRKKFLAAVGHYRIVAMARDRGVRFRLIRHLAYSHRIQSASLGETVT